MSKTITFDIFDPASIQRAAQEIREYSKWVQDKTVELRKRIGERIRREAQHLFYNAVVDVNVDDDFGEEPDVYDVAVEDNGDITVIVAHGKDAIFIEFGAGVFFNGAVGSSPNPLVGKNGLKYTIGSYGKGRGKQEKWAYKGKDGEVHWTYGTRATMPMYRSIVAVADDIVTIAKEVFST